MGDLFRSQPVSYGQLIVPINVAEETIEKLGEINCVQFVDLNENEISFNRRYCNEIKRCDELERKIRYFNEMINKEEERKDFGGLKFRKITKREEVEGISLEENETIENLEIQLEAMEKDLKQINADCSATETDLNKIEESLLVTNNIEILFENMKDNLVIGGNLKFMIGVIEKVKYESVQRLIWRVSRGLVLIKSMDLTTESNLRNFICIYQGEDLEMKINKICQTSGARIYSNIPLDHEQRQEFINEQDNNKQQLNRIFEGSTKEKRDLLKKIALKINIWKELVERQRLIYFTLNMFKIDKGSTLTGECWYPSEFYEKIINKLAEMDQNVMAPIFSPIQAPKKAIVPTYNKLNSFTSCFQDLTNSYGIPRYGEVNTAWLNIVTFPFLFGIMFSDVGHGLFIFLIGVVFLLFQKKLSKINLNEIVLMLFDARWLLVFMGLFAMYCGAIFNEWFGFSVDFFGTSWSHTEGDKEYHREDENYVYYFGVDPIWKSSNNELYFLNSLKMKLSILIGVIHMTFGICLSCFNHLNDKKKINIYFHFIPELCFMVFSFGYLCFLIVFKWCNPDHDPAPMLTNVFLEMFQNFGVVTEPNKIFEGQQVVEPILLILIVISVLVMFVPKPILSYLELRKKQKKLENPDTVGLLEGVDFETDTSSVLEDEELFRPKVEEEEEENEEGNSLMEIIIFNSIHAIEFILGCISNTASYLRLWALSLAHAELGTVFLEHVFYLLLESANCVAIFLGFGAWGFITIGILIGMESLSAFLHTLRLHWIEFQNKFYVGDGVLFTPLVLPERI